MYLSYTKLESIERGARDMQSISVFQPSNAKLDLVQIEQVMCAQIWSSSK